MLNYPLAYRTTPGILELMSMLTQYGYYHEFCIIVITLGEVGSLLQ